MDKPTQIDMEHLRTWIGRQETRVDQINKFPLLAMSATLDQPAPEHIESFTLPPLWHWLYFLSLTSTSQLAQDGHSAKGKFLPPVPLNRRMWAGGKLSFKLPLKYGDNIKRISTIADIKRKTGRSGELVFVSVKHSVYTGDQLAIEEQQDIVYRDKPKNNSVSLQQVPATSKAQWSKEIVPDETLLFRYSALTFNAHKIHYDKTYTQEVDGYTDLVVHGPLVATLLLDLLVQEQPKATISNFSYKGIRPLLITSSFTIEACFTKGTAESSANKQVSLWAKDTEGWITMKAVAELCLA